MDNSVAHEYEYHSNPFIATVQQLSRCLNINSISTLTLGVLLIAVIFVVVFVSGLLAALFHNTLGTALVFLFVFIAYLLVVLRFAAASLYIHIATQEGRTVTARQAVQEVAKRNYNKFVLTTLLTGVILTAGFIAFILPGIYLVGRLALAPFIAMAEGVGVGAAIKRSWKLTNGHWAETVSALLASIVVVPSGLLSLVGTQSGLARRYYEYTALETSGAPKPKTHWMNYALPVIIFVLVGAYVGFYAALFNSAKSSCDTYSIYNSSCNTLPTNSTLQSDRYLNYPYDDPGTGSPAN